MTSPYRARMMGTKHMIAAGHYLATQAGFQILEDGGNAIDAGVGAGITLGVVLGEYVNFGGVAPIAIYSAEKDEVVTIAGLGWWPKATDIRVFQNEYGGKIPQGVLRTVIPAAPDAWITALLRYGTMRFSDVVAPALHLARDGFPTSFLSNEIISSKADSYRRWPSGAEVFLPNGEPPAVGDVFVQTDLANTFQYLVDEEKSAGDNREAGLNAARDAFYKGDIAEKIVRFHQENGGWMTAEDLAGYSSEVEPAPRVTFQDFDVYGCGPWCQGPVILETLKILDGMDVGKFGHNSADYVHVLVESLKLAFSDRHAYVGDPRFVDVPFNELLSKEFAEHRRAAIDMKKASPGMPASGTAEQLGITAARKGPASPTVTKENAEIALDTSYVSVIDRQGNAFSATPSDGTYAAPIIPGTGFLPSPRGVQSWTDPDHPACVAPGKRPRLTPNPAIAMKKGEWLMPFGSPGNDVQPQAILQTLLNIHVFGMTPQEALDQPRFATLSFPQSTDPHPYNPGRLQLEGRFDDDTADDLSNRGHDVQWWPDWHWLAGAPCTVLKNQKTGVLEGGSDPRRPTGVAGW
jgi:gamma-glutamyltranspeptidase/glutathione hydrolase